MPLAEGDDDALVVAVGVADGLEPPGSGRGSGFDEAEDDALGHGDAEAESLGHGDGALLAEADDDGLVDAVGVADGLEPPVNGSWLTIELIGSGEPDGDALEHASAAPAGTLLDRTSAGATSSPPAIAAPIAAAAARDRRVFVI